MNTKYLQYRQLHHKEKKERIAKAHQSEKHRQPNPQGIREFDEMGFIEYKVHQEQNLINLETYRHNSKIQPPVGVFFMFHGLNSYMGHGAHLAEYFSQHGYITVGFDHRGFGRSEGIGGFVDSLELHLQDSLTFIEMVKPMYSQLPKFIIGLSMGGMTAYHLTLANSKLFDGAILMAPALKNSVSGFLVSLSDTMSKILPHKTRLTKPIYGQATKNPTITEDTKNDKYAFSQRICLATISMLTKTMDKSPATFKDYQCPFLIVQGGLDKLVNPEVAFELYDNSKVPYEDKQILFYQNMWHDIWHQQQIYEIMQKIVEWTNKRIIRMTPMVSEQVQTDCPPKHKKNKKKKQNKHKNEQQMQEIKDEEVKVEIEIQTEPLTKQQEEGVQKGNEPEPKQQHFQPPLQQQKQQGKQQEQKQQQPESDPSLGLEKQKQKQKQEVAVNLQQVKP